MSVERFSSRRERLDRAFLAKRLANATSYRRIAGYFRSSIAEATRRLGAALLTCTASVARLSSPLTEPCLVRMKSLFRHAIRMGTKTKMMRT